MSTLPSPNFSGSVDAPTEPTETATPAPVEQSAATVLPSGDSADSLIGLPELRVPAPVAGDGEVLLAVDGPWYVQVFNPSIADCPTIERSGTPVPVQFVDKVVSAGAVSGVTIIKR